MTGIDACRRGWVAVTLEASGAAGPLGAVPASVRVHGSLASLLAADPVAVTGIDMPLGLVESGWREADRAARRLLGPRRSSVFAIPPEAVWAEPSYQAANQRCRELTGQGFSIQAWGLRAKLLEANRYRQARGHPLYEVHPELAFGAMAGAPLPYSKHTAPGRELRRELLASAGIVLPAALSGAAGLSGAGRPAAGLPAGLAAGVASMAGVASAAIPVADAAPVKDTLDAAAVAWSAWRIATGQAIVIPDYPQLDRQGREITIRY